MAPITWRNVDAPDLTKASRIMNDAVGNWSRGFGGASDALMDARERQKSNRSAELIDDLASIKGEAGVDAFLQGLPGMIQSRDMTDDLQKAILGLRSVAQGYDTSRLTQEGIRARTAATRAASGRAADKANREREREAELAEFGKAALHASMVEGGLIDGGSPGLPVDPQYPIGEPIVPGSETTADGSLSFGAPVVQVNPWQAALDRVMDSKHLSPKDLFDTYQAALDQANSANTYRDEDRSRDDVHTQTSKGRKTNAAALALAQDVVLNAPEEADIVRMIATDPDATPEVKRAAIGMLEGMDIAGMRTLPRDLETPPVVDPKALETVETSLAAYVNEQNAALAHNVDARIQNNIAKYYSDGDPMLTLIEQLGATDEQRGAILAAGNRIQREANVSPAVAAAALYETVRAVGFFNLPFDGLSRGDIKLDTGAAIDLLKQMNTPKARSVAVGISTQAAQNKAAAEQISSDIDALWKRATYITAQGGTPTKELARLDALMKRALTIHQDRKVVGHTPSDDPEFVKSPEGQSIQLLSQMTSLPVEQLAKMHPATLIKVINTLKREASGDPLKTMMLDMLKDQLVQK